MAGAQGQVAAAEDHPLDAVTPSWLQIGGQIRGRLEVPSGSGFVPGTYDPYLLTRIRLNVLIQPVSWLKFYAEAQDTRAPGYNGTVPGSFRNPLDLRAGYVEAGHGEKSGFFIRTGRQELTLGGGRVIGSGDWTNTTKTFDIIRAAVFRPGIRLELLAGSIVLVDSNRFDRHKPGEHFYASYNHFDRLVPHTSIEPYFIAKTVVGVTGSHGPRGDAAIYTSGLRWTGTLPRRVDFSAETLGQWGSWAADTVSASAGIYTLGWTLNTSRYKPRISSDYSFGTGQRSATDRNRGFDVLYGSNQPFLSLSGLVGWRNMRNLRVGTDFAVRKNLKAFIDYRDYFLFSTADGLYNTSAAEVVLNRKATSTHVGQDFSVQMAWTTEILGQVGVGISELLAGSYLRQSGKSSGYLYPYMVWSKRF